MTLAFVDVNANNVGITEEAEPADEVRCIGIYGDIRVVASTCEEVRQIIRCVIETEEESEGLFRSYQVESITQV